MLSMRKRSSKSFLTSHSLLRVSKRWNSSSSSSASLDDLHDVVVVGAGPGGYTCAVRAAQHGLKVAVVEKERTVGGTCLNVGCIPSKSLLHSSHLLSEARHSSFLKNPSNFGFDLSKAMKEKEKAVDTLTGGIDFLFKKHAVSRIRGIASFIDPHTLSVQPSNLKSNKHWGSSESIAGGAGGDHVKKLKAKHIVVATGSEITPLRGIEIDDKSVLSSTGALSLQKVPKSMVVVGAGVIGLELGSMWSRLGTKVTVVEFLPRILPPVEGEIASMMHKSLKKQGMSFLLGKKVVAVEKLQTSNSNLRITVEAASASDGSKPTLIDSDTVLVAIGRRPYTSGLGLNKIGVEVLKNGEIPVDRNTLASRAHSHIYAIGDAIFGPWLAHKAEIEGLAVADRIAHSMNKESFTKPSAINYGAIPAVVYTQPEVSGVGLTTEECKSKGIVYAEGKSHARANPRSRATGLSDGLCKLIADKSSGRLIGMHMMGMDAAELVTAGTYAVNWGIKAKDLGDVCHAHPSFAESIKEAAHELLHNLKK